MQRTPVGYKTISMKYFASLFLLFVSFSVQAQHSNKKLKRPPYIKPQPPVINNNSPEAGPANVETGSNKPAAVPFDFEAYKEEGRITDSLARAENVLYIADSMTTQVLKAYANTGENKDAIHPGLKTEHYERYYQSIVLKPYKGIWHVWYFFRDDLYHGQGQPAGHYLPRKFPYHFEIVVDSKKRTAGLRKGVFNASYKPE